MSSPPQTWQEIASSFQTRRAASIPQQWLLPQGVVQPGLTNVTEVALQLLSTSEVEITGLGASELARRIAARQYTSLEVTEAFCHRAAIAHQLTNSLTEIFFDQGLEQAKQLDHVLQSTGKLVGPLHGVPVSIKDHYNVKGHFTTAGYCSWSRFPRKEQDAHIVEILRNAGAVFYAKTNNPQCMMVLETVSNIYGRTLNPWNIKLGAGGSSGGEGSLLAMHGSPLGVGSDIGGSIRIPAAFNGLYGFKPSGKRIVPVGGWECTMMGSEAITAVAGPLGHSVEDLELFMQIASDAEPWLKEPMLDMPWRPLQFAPDERLNVGVMASDRVVTPHPYITRVIREVAERLKNAGHDVIDFEPYKHKEVWDEILLPLYFEDGGLDIKQTLAASGEPMFPSAKRLIEDPLVKVRDVHEVWKLRCARDGYKIEYLKHWNDTASRTASGRPIDILICPNSPVQGTPHDNKPWWGYCSQWNVLDYPSGVLPAGQVQDSDSYPPSYTPLNELDEEHYKMFEPSLYRGCPVTIQVVGRSQQDEKVMACMKIIDKVINP